MSSPTLVRAADLYYQDLRSNKEYHLQLIYERISSRYRVLCQFGPRGGTLTHVDLTKGEVTYTQAMNIYTNKLGGKINKGYKHMPELDSLKARIMKAVGIAAWELDDKQWNKLVTFVNEYAEEVV